MESRIEVVWDELPDTAEEKEATVGIVIDEVFAVPNESVKELFEKIVGMIKAYGGKIID